MSRTSTIYRSGGVSGRRSHRTMVEDQFPILEFKEISICLQSCDFIANEELVSNPHSQYMRTLLEQFLDTFMGLSASNIENMANSNNKNQSVVKNNGNGSTTESSSDDQDNNDDIVPSLKLLLLHRAASEFFSICGIDDFTLMDIMRPEPSRVRRILSAVVNYARFREVNSAECEKLVTISEVSLEKLREAQNDNTTLSNNITQLKEKLEASETEEGNKRHTIKQINLYNSKLEVELKKLKRSQEDITLEYAKYKEEKKRLIEKLEDHNYLIMESNKELEKLKTYILPNPEILTRLIEDLKSNLKSSQMTLVEMEDKNKNLVITIESVQIIEQELKNLFRVLEELLSDLTKEESMLEKLAKLQEFKEESNLNLTDLNRQIQQINRQLKSTEEKIERLRSHSRERSEASKQRLASLKEDYDRLVKERKLKEQELTQKKTFISNLEAKMGAEKNDFQVELRNAELAVAKLNSHVKLYLAEMDKKIN